MLNTCDKAPTYPELPVWLALAAELRARGEIELLNDEGHQLFVAAYTEELKRGG